MVGELLTGNPSVAPTSCCGCSARATSSVGNTVRSLAALCCGCVAIGSGCLLAASPSVGLTIGICLSAWVNPLNFSGATSLLCPKYHPAPPTIIKTAIATAMRVDLRGDGGEICTVAIGPSL